MTARGRPGAEPRLRVQARGRAGGRHGRRHRARRGHQLGAHRRQRQRARRQEPAGQRPPDVAADAAGARLAERRHRHLAGHPLQRPRHRAERHPVRRHRRVGDHRRLAGQPERRDPDAVQAAGEPRERAGVPRRVEQLPGRVRHRHRRPGERRHQVGRQHLPRLGLRVPPQRRARRAELLRHGTPGCRSRPLEQHQFGGSIGGPIAKNRAFFFGSYEGYHLDAGINFVEAVPSAAAWARAVPAIAALRPGSCARARSSCRARPRTPTSTSRSCRGSSRCGRTPSARGSTSR